MAFDATGMTLWSHGRNRKLYHYESSDALTAIKAANYFDDFEAQLAAGDVVVIQASDGFAIQRVNTIGPLAMAGLADEGVLTDSTGGTTDGTVDAMPAVQSTPTGAIQAELDAIDNNFAELTTKVNAILRALGA